MPGLNSHLARAFHHSETDPFFVGYKLAQLRRQENLTLEQQADALHLDLEQLAFLSLCQTPKDLVDVELLAGKVGMSAAKLAQLLGIPEMD
jgi:hypothetical protein